MLSIDSPLRVRYAETDQMGIVHHSRYLIFFEQGRTDWLRAAGSPYGKLEEQGFLLPVTRVEVRYRRPARFEDELIVRTTLVKATVVTLDHRYEVVRGGELLVQGESTVACVDREGRPRTLPDALRAVLSV
jgi:acyl-CoA thioester hydrolase